MNELINLMYQIKDLSTRTNEIALIDLQPRLMAVYNKLEIERLSICDVSNTLKAYAEWQDSTKIDLGAYTNEEQYKLYLDSF